MKRYSTEALMAATNRAPSVVQEVVNSDETSMTVAAIGMQHKLHIDQIGILADLNIQMLLGLIHPAEFLSSLLEAHIPELEARKIMGEINEKIFKPLQADMRKGGGGQQVSAIPSPAPRYEPPAPPPQPRPVPPPPPQPSITLPPMSPAGASAAQLRPTPPQPAVQAAPEWQAPPPSPMLSAAPLPPRTVLPGATAPRFIKPMQVAAPEIPRGAPPANLPTHTPPATAPRVAGASSAAQPEDAAFNALPPLAKPQPLSSQGDPNAPHTRYPADPYREPIE